MKKQKTFQNWKFFLKGKFSHEFPESRPCARNKKEFDNDDDDDV